MVLQGQTAGLLKQNTLNFCYAYGIRFNENLNLRFGLAAGFRNIRTQNSLNSGLIVGNPNDPAISAYNSIPPSLYNAFSFTLYTKNIELQAVAPNLTASLQNKNLQTLDYPVLQTGLTYKHTVGGGKLLNENSYIKVFAGMMQYKQTGSTITGAVMLSANDLLSGMIQYNSSGVLTAGIGVEFEKKYRAFISYSTGGLYSKAIYGGGGIAEIHLNYSLNKK